MDSTSNSQDANSSSHDQHTAAPAAAEPAQPAWDFNLSHTQENAVNVDAQHYTVQQHDKDDYNLQGHFHDYHVNGDVGGSHSNNLDLHNLTASHTDEHHQQLNIYEAPQEHHAAPAFENHPAFDTPAFDTHHPAFDTPSHDVGHSAFDTHGGFHDMAHDHGSSSTHDHSGGPGHDSGVSI